MGVGVCLPVFVFPMMNVNNFITFCCNFILFRDLLYITMWHVSFIEIILSRSFIVLPKLFSPCCLHRGAVAIDSCIQCRTINPLSIGISAQQYHYKSHNSSSRLVYWHHRKCYNVCNTKSTPNKSKVLQKTLQLCNQIEWKQIKQKFLLLLSLLAAFMLCPALLPIL